MKARVIQTKFWNDAFVGDLSTSEKLVFLYLLTNEHANILHCFECPDRTILFDTGVNREQLESAKQKLESAGKIRFFKGWVHLVNGERYQQFTGDKNDRAKETLEREMSAEVFAWYKGNSDTPIDTPIEGVCIPSVISNQYPVTNKKGGVGENKKPESSPTYLQNIPLEDLEKFSADFNLKDTSVQKKADQLFNWYETSPKRNRRENWRAVLRNALDKDQDELRAKETTGKNPKIIDVTHLL